MLSAGLAACNRGGSVESLVAEAKTYQQKGDHKAALIQLKNAVTQSPDDGALRIALGQAYLDTFDPVSAEKEYRKALALGSKPEQLLLGLTRALHAQGQYKKVLEDTEAVVGQSDPDITLMRADALLALGRHDEAKEAYGAVIKARPDGMEALNGMARYYFATGDLAAADQAADQAVAKYPADAETLLLKAKLLQAQKKTDEAAALYDKVLKLYPLHRTAHIDKAYLDIEAKRFDAAQADIEAARKANPQNQLVLYMQALLDFSKGNHVLARESLQKLMIVAPDYLPGVLLLAVCEMKAGAVELSQRNARKYLETYPDNAFARNLLISMLLKGGQTVEATSNVVIALRDQPPSAQLYGLAGQVYLQGGDYAKASGYFEKASAMDPKASGLRTALGLSRLGLGDMERGVGDLELATHMDSATARAALILVAAQLRLRQYDKALASIAALEKNMPNDANLINLRGVAYASKREREPARENFLKALALQPNYLAAATNLSQLYVADKKPELARKLFEDFLEKNKGNNGAMAALANLSMSAGKPDEALKWLERALSDNPNSLDAAVRLGHAYLRAGKTSEALALLRKFQTTNSTSTELLDLLGQAQLASGDGPGAVESYGKIAALLPKSAEVQYQLASAQSLSRNDNAALASLKRALALKPDFKEAMLAQAELSVRRGDLVQALTLALQLQKKHPRDAVGYALEGSLLSAQRKPAEALKSYEKAFALAPEAAHIIKIHGALIQLGNDKLADAKIALWQAQHPKDTTTELYLAEYEIARKQYPAAGSRLENLIKVLPDNPVALNNLAWTYQQLNDPRALETAEKAFRHAPTSPGVLDTLGWILVEKGDGKRGLPLLRKAVALAPGGLDIRLHLAQGLIKSSDKSGARTELEFVTSHSKNPAQLAEAKELLKQL